MRIFPYILQSQSDLTSNGVKSQAYDDPITRSKPKALTYVEVTLQSSFTTLDQDKDIL